LNDIKVQMLRGIEMQTLPQFSRGLWKKMFWFKRRETRPAWFENRLFYVKLTQQHVLEYISLYMMVRG